MKLKSIASSLVCSGLFSATLGFSPATQAGTATANLNVTATVVNNCLISTSAVAFGTYDTLSASPSNASGSVTITCTQGASATVTLDLGANAVVTQRKMAAGAERINYELYHPPNTTAGTACSFPATQVWGTSGAEIFSPAAAPNNQARTFNVCGTIAGAQSVPAGSYSDTVVATVNF